MPSNIGYLPAVAAADPSTGAVPPTPVVSSACRAVTHARSLAHELEALIETEDA
jgi:hypothetical protein